eukprot:scaffold118082_cov34-Tisochrysis_lutea.AAC.5
MPKNSTPNARYGRIRYRAAGLCLGVTVSHMSVMRGITTSNTSTNASNHAPKVAPGIIMMRGRSPSQISERAQPRRRLMTSTRSANARISLPKL